MALGINLRTSISLASQIVEEKFYGTTFANASISRSVVNLCCATTICVWHQRRFGVSYEIKVTLRLSWYRDGFEEPGSEFVMPFLKYLWLLVVYQSIYSSILQYIKV